MKRIFQILAAISIVVLMFSCDKNRVFDEYKPIENKIWDKDSLLIFTVPITDTTHNYNIKFNVRNDVKYNFSNLWVFLEIIQPNGLSVTDTTEIGLADPSGQWLGNGFGGLKEKETLYRRNVYFPQSGNYKIKIRQGMREDKLKGISDFGIRIEKVK
jgi:gliding motility-associated lipoprotein GldH